MNEWFERLFRALNLCPSCAHGEHEHCWHYARLDNFCSTLGPISGDPCLCPECKDKSSQR
jgi:hypothetical protein